MIQWGKFARMGKILSVIPDFQSRGTMAPGHASVTFRRLIEATPVIGSEDVSTKVQSAEWRQSGDKNRFILSMRHQGNLG